MIRIYHVARERGHVVDERKRRVRVLRAKAPTGATRVSGVSNHFRASRSDLSAGSYQPLHQSRVETRFSLLRLYQHTDSLLSVVRRIGDRYSMRQEESGPSVLDHLHALPVISLLSVSQLFVKAKPAIDVLLIRHDRILRNN